MTFAVYVTRRLIGAWVVITLLLALLFSFVGFFEKLMQVKHATIASILHFLFLSTVPQAFDLMPVALWLATLVVLRDLTSSSAWDFLRLVGVAPWRLYTLVASLSLGILLIVAVVRESVVLDLGARAERFKQEQFKHAKTGAQLVNRWFELEQGTFCFLGAFDGAAGRGEDVLMVTTSSQFELLNIHKADYCTADRQSNMLVLHNVVSLEGPKFSPQERLAVACQQPSFFSYVAVQGEAQGLLNLVKGVAFQTFLPESTTLVIHRLLLQSIFFYLTFLLYPLLALFFFSQSTMLLAQWGGALLPFPLLVGLGLCVSWAAGLPYAFVWVPLLLILILVLLWFMLRPILAKTALLHRLVR